MIESEYAKKNSVSSKGQLEETKFVKIVRKENSRLKVLFVGNSITRHAPAPQIGWYGDWGMAASCEENDFVHQTMKGIEEKYGPTDYCVAQAAEWERRYFEGNKSLEEFYIPARDFCADVVIIRIGENINRDKNKEINCKPYYDQMIKFFVSNPKAQVIVTDNFWQIEVLDRIFKEVIDENGYTYCKISDLERDEKTMAIGQFEHEGVSMHPSDYGMKKIAERILEKVYEKVQLG